MVDDPPDQTLVLLREWHRGNAGALAELVQRELPWVEARVRARLGPLLRQRHDTQDIVQEAVIGTLSDGPRFVVADRRSFRGLLVRIVENVIRRKHTHMTAKRRDGRREAPLPSSDTVLDLSGVHAPEPSPSEAAHANEMRGWVRLALELLSVDDREIVVLREYEGLPFEAIGAQLSISDNAARMRFQRALARLGVVLDRLRTGRLADFLDDIEAGRCTTPGT
ncbi:MAG: RNA polymerase sigma factor [Planctomycetota bacterium]